MFSVRCRPIGKAAGAVLLVCSLSGAQTPRVVPTFHCLGIYWSPSGGSAGADVLVQYRGLGASQWQNGLAMRYRPIAGTDEDKADYRGSIVGLTPGTHYEIKLTLAGTATEEPLTAATWDEDFPEGEVTTVADATAPYDITESGTADAYRVFDGSAATIRVDESEEACITVEASHVIIRGFTLVGGRNGIRLYDGCGDIVIEDCDISGWGRPRADPSVPDHGEDYNGAVFSNDENLTRVVMQRNLMHHPATASNSWVHGHPTGPQCIVFWNSRGNHVIRYNECFSDDNHYFNDILGAGSNSGWTGFPGADSDIYGNYIANSRDDGIETEGGNRNVRVWNNFVTNTLMAIANAATTIGPYYVWRNVCGVSYSPPGSEWDMTHGNFMKMGYAGSETYMTGHMYVFHNTIYQIDDTGFNGLGGSGRIIKHCVTRNNILHVRSDDSRSIAVSNGSEDNDFDFDLCNKGFPSGHEAHGVNGTPVYVDEAGFDADGRTGSFQLKPSSPGYDAGEVIPNFSDGFTGEGPDMGAHEHGREDFVYGARGGAVEAKRERSPLTRDTRGALRELMKAGGPEIYTLAGRRVGFRGSSDPSRTGAGFTGRAGVYLVRVGGRDARVAKWVRY